jgi:hypothetical protein
MVGNWKDCKIAMVLGSKLTAGGWGGGKYYEDLRERPKLINKKKEREKC